MASYPPRENFRFSISDVRVPHPHPRKIPADFVSPGRYAHMPRNSPETAGIGRTALLDASDGDDDSTVIHGVAMSTDDLLTMTMPDGELNPARWSADALAKIASTLENRPLTDEHTDNPRAVVGEVRSARFDPESGEVRYTAELDDETLAERIANGRLEVSPRVTHRSADELDTDGGVLVIGPGDTGEFRHLMICQRTDRSTGRETRPALGPESSTAEPGAPDASPDSPTADASDMPDSPVADAGDTARSPAVAAFESREGSHVGDTHGGRERPHERAHTDASAGDDDANNLVQQAASARVLLAAGREGVSAAGFIEERYGLDASDYSAADTLRRDIADAEADDDGAALTDAAAWDRR